MERPKLAQKNPYVVDVEAGKTYYWCACGRSSTQPFCDGSHKTTPFSSIPFTAEKSEKKFFCGCKRTKTPPFCDGSHKTADPDD